MSSYCYKIDCNCKYCDEKDGCIFFSQGSGNEIDMPCYKTDDLVSALYEIQEICKKLDVRIEINSMCLIFRRSGEINNKAYVYNQAFNLFEIEKLYGNLDECADEFMRRLNQEKEKMRGDSECHIV